MHECPICGEMCDCDGDDLFTSIVPADCEHCDPNDEDRDWYNWSVPDEKN